MRKFFMLLGLLMLITVMAIIHTFLIIVPIAFAFLCISYVSLLVYSTVSGVDIPVLEYAIYVGLTATSIWILYNKELFSRHARRVRDETTPDFHDNETNDR